MRFTPLHRLALSAGAVALMAFAPPAVAGGEEAVPTTETAITSPEGRYFSYFDVDAEYGEGSADENDNGTADVNEVTISGTANGDEWLNLYCVYGDDEGGGREYFGSIDGTDVDANESGGYSWSLLVDKEELYAENYDVGDAPQACKLVAIPESEYVGSADLSRFRGITLGMGIVVNSDEYYETRDRAAAEDTPQTRGKDEWVASNYYAAFPQSRGFFAYTSIGDEGIAFAAPFSPSTFALAEDETWDRGGAQRRWGAGRNDLRIDGEDAFNAHTAPSSVYDDAEDEWVGINGQPHVSLEIESFDERTGNVTFLETQGLVRCATPEEDPEAPTERGGLSLEECPELEPTGVALERRVVQGRDGRASSITDRYVAVEDADGEITSHSIDVQYQNETDADDDPTWRLPGESEYAMFDEDDEIDLPQSPIGTFISRDAEGNDVPEDTAGPGSLTYTSRPDRAHFDTTDELVLTYRREVPAEGGLRLTHVYGMAQDMGGIERLVSSIEDGLTSPLVAITAPVNGSSTSSQRITATGTASDDATLVRVNGRSVPVLPDGTWSAELELQPGANTVTAVAVDGEGLTGQDTRSVTYAPAAAAQQVAPSRSAKITKPVSLLSKRMRLKKNRTFRLTIRCVAGGPQSGTIRVRTRGKNARTIAVKAYQCPGGGKRHFSFRMSLDALRSKGIKGRRSVPMSAYVVGENENGQNIMVKETFTLVLR